MNDEDKNFEKAIVIILIIISAFIYKSCIGG